MLRRSRSFLVLLVVVLGSATLSSCGNESDAPPISNDRINTLVIQSDGKIIAAGDAYHTNRGWQLALMRFNGNGTLDSTFGRGGKVLTHIYGGAQAVVVQSDGKIVAGGATYDGQGLFTLLRLDSHGNPDASFGSGGEVSTPMNGAIAALALQSDGRIVAAGYSDNGNGNDFALVRYNGSGAVDTTFGNGGIARTTTADYLITGAGATSVAIQADGKIVAAGGSFLIRYNDDGSLDTGFGSGGRRLTGSYYEQTSAVVLQDDGKMVAAGSSWNGNGYDLAVTRHDASGSPDPLFGASGRAVAPVSNLYTLAPASVMVEPLSGAILATGYSQYQFVVSRFSGAGVLEGSFASSGMLSLGNGGNANYRCAALQGDGKFIVAGSLYQSSSGDDDFAVARFNSDGSPDTSFGNNGVATAGM